MIDGVNEDDKYRMVEDEFISIASQFTTHLHRAEYQRLKQQAKAQNADKIWKISRPTVGALTAAAKKRQEMRKHLAKQRDGLRKAAANAKAGQGNADDDEDGFPDVILAGASLHGLMERPEKAERPLSHLTSTTTSTRASAGFERSSSDLRHPSQAFCTNFTHTLQRSTQRVTTVDEMETESDTLDDPDTPVAKSSTTVLSRGRESLDETHNLLRPVARDTQRLRQELCLPKKPVSRRMERTERYTTTAEVEREETSIDDNEDDVFGRLRTQRQSNRPRREESRADSLAKTKRDENRDVIPAFL